MPAENCAAMQLSNIADVNIPLVKSINDIAGLSNNESLIVSIARSVDARIIGFCERRPTDRRTNVPMNSFTALGMLCVLCFYTTFKKNRVATLVIELTVTDCCVRVCSHTRVNCTVVEKDLIPFLDVAFRAQYRDARECHECT